MLEAMQLVSTNNSALIQCNVGMLIKNLFMQLTPEKLIQYDQFTKALYKWLPIPSTQFLHVTRKNLGRYVEKKRTSPLVTISVLLFYQIQLKANFNHDVEHF